MRSNFAFREPPMLDLEQRPRIRWDDLGQPIEPCFREYQGELIEVRQRDIEAAQGNPNAVFTALRFRPWTGPAYYRLGFLQIRDEPRSAVALTPPNANPRRLLIKWSDLGVPSRPGKFRHQGLIVDVQEKNIEAASGNPEAVFAATQIRPHIGPPYYVLGRVEIPKPGSALKR
jgi:hypothetical protein